MTKEYSNDYDSELVIERVMLGASPELSTSITVMGYRSEHIHRECIDTLDTLQDMCEDVMLYDNPIGPASPKLDTITKLNSIVAKTMLRSKTITDTHKKAILIHHIDVLHAAINDLMNKTNQQAEEIIKLYTNVI